MLAVEQVHPLEFAGEPSSSVAVIVPAYNEENTVAEVVATALRFTPDVIVVSNGSSDRTAECARAAGARVVERQAAGKGPALYAGLLATQAEYVLMLDADLVGLTVAHLQALLEPVRSGKLDMVIGVFSEGGFMTDFGNRMTPQLSGQRAARRAWLLSVPRLGAERWPEPAITHALKKQGVRWDYVALPKLSQVMKEEKRGFWRGMRHRSKMYLELLTFRRRRRRRAAE